MHEDREIIPKIEGLRAYGDPDGAALWSVDGRKVIRVWTQGGHDFVDIDLGDLVEQGKALLRERANA